MTAEEQRYEDKDILQPLLGAQQEKDVFKHESNVLYLNKSIRVFRKEEIE